MNQTGAGPEVGRSELVPVHFRCRSGSSSWDGRRKWTGSGPRWAWRRPAGTRGLWCVLLSLSAAKECPSNMSTAVQKYHIGRRTRGVDDNVQLWLCTGAWTDGLRVRSSLFGDRSMFRNCVLLTSIGPRVLTIGHLCWCHGILKQRSTLSVTLGETLVRLTGQQDLQLYARADGH